MEDKEVYLHGWDGTKLIIMQSDYEKIKDMKLELHQIEEMLGDKVKRLYGRQNFHNIEARKKRNNNGQSKG